MKKQTVATNTKADLKKYIIFVCVTDSDGKTYLLFIKNDRFSESDNCNLTKIFSGKIFTKKKALIEYFIHAHFLKILIIYGNLKIF